MKKKFYQLEVTIKGTKKNHHAVLINRYEDLENAKRFLETLKEEIKNDIENVVIKSINPKIL
jgi:hypothetical protein